MVQDSNNTFELIERLQGFEQLEGVVGLFGDAGSAQASEDLTIAALGYLQEVGAEIRVTPKMRAYLHSQGLHLSPSTTHITIPARPWFSVGFERAMPDMEAVIGQGVNQVIEGSLNAGELLDRATLIGEAQIKEYALSNVPPPNHPFTIEQKGSSKTLVDTGRMVGSVTHGHRPRTADDA